MNQSVVSRAPHRDLALSAYLEPLADGRRVLMLGDAQGPTADRLDTVARLLDIIDPSAREPSRGPVPELPFDDASFDLVIVCDIGALPEPRAHAIRELRRVLEDDGVLVACTPAGGKRARRGEAQAALEALVSEQFRHVSLIRQSAVAGYALSLFDAAVEDEFAIDSSLVQGREELVEQFVAVATDYRVKLEPRLWVQVPPGDVAKPAAADPVSFEVLRKLENEARESSQRERDAVSALEAEKKKRSEAEQKAERARALERRLRDAEADYDDAVARLRYLEGEIADKEAACDSERTKRENAEQELAQREATALAADGRVRSAEAQRDAARAEAEALTSENAEGEKRFQERGAALLELEREKKRHETLARDLVEELRRLEQHKLADVEHDARVAELEAERDRAVQRALESEVAREAAQMRVDELRVQVHQAVAQQHAAVRPGPDAETEATLRRLHERVAELESALADASASSARVREPVAVIDPLASQRRGEVTGLTLRLDEAETALRHALARPALLPVESGPDVEALLADARADHRVGIERLETQLSAVERRNDALERELEEADRFAEAHADDAERIEALEIELEAARRRLDSMEDDLRATQDELRAAKIDGEHVSVEASARIELAQRRESEARLERDAARSALEDARAMLSQLAGAAVVGDTRLHGEAPDGD